MSYNTTRSMSIPQTVKHIGTSLARATAGFTDLSILTIDLVKAEIVNTVFNNKTSNITDATLEIDHSLEELAKAMLAYYADPIRVDLAKFSETASEGYGKAKLANIELGMKNLVEHGQTMHS